MEEKRYKNEGLATGQVIEILQKQNGHPIHASQIGDRINLSGSQVCDIILELRCAGMMICGDDAYDGFYFGNPAEYKETIKRLNNRIKLEQLAVNMWAHKLKKAAEELENQKAQESEQLPGKESMDI